MTIKLSEAMETALYRIHDHAWSGANPRTIEALIKRGLLVQGPDSVSLTDAGREHLGVAVEDFPADSIMEDTSGVEAPTFHQQLMADVAELEEALKGDPGGEKPQETPEPITTRGMLKDSALADWELDLLNITRAQAERFDVSLDRKMNEFLGFGEVYNWDNPEVWNGLTAREIAEDLATRVPSNRADKRRQKRFLGRQWRKLFSFRPRKALKLTGARGL